MPFNPLNYRKPNEAIGNPEDARETNPDVATTSWIGLGRGILYALINGVPAVGGHTDDAAFTVGTGKVNPAGATYRSTRDAVDDGDAGILAMNAKRGLYVSPESPNGDSLVDDTNDRLNVGLIASQNGIDGGAGAVTAKTPRVSLASDDPAVAALQIMDDWDESDRAKVNPIVGQAGVAAGAGAVGVTVQRTTLASDDPAVTALQVIDDWDESDRAKVNPIAGQAGVAAGAGAVGVTVQRMTLASDDPAVAVLGATTGAAVITDADGTIQRYLRGIVKLLITSGTIILGAGANIIGKVGVDQTTEGTTNRVVAQKVAYIEVTLSLDTVAYASGDVLADTQVVTNATRVADMGGIIQSVTLIDEDDQKVALKLLFFDANVALGTENAAPSISDANARNFMGPIVSFGAADYEDLGGVAVAALGNLGIAIKPASGTRDIYVAALNGTGTPTYTASGLKLRLGILQD